MLGGQRPQHPPWWPTREWTLGLLDALVFCVTLTEFTSESVQAFFWWNFFLIFNFEITTDFHEVARKKVQGVPVYFDPVSLNDSILDNKHSARPGS